MNRLWLLPAMLQPRVCLLFLFLTFLVPAYQGHRATYVGDRCKNVHHFYPCLAKFSTIFIKLWCQMPRKIFLNLSNGFCLTNLKMKILLKNSNTYVRVPLWLYERHLWRFLNIFRQHCQIKPFLVILLNQNKQM